MEKKGPEISHIVDKRLRDKRFQLGIKRAFDIVMSIIGILILGIPMIIVAIAIKLDSNGPVFFRQSRVTLGNKDFKIYKFRTMVTDAEKKGMQITVGKDSRITKVGHILRKTKIDELPQLFNVLSGDMSFVGPRPEVRKYVDLYDERQKNVLKIKSGITDLASIEYSDESTLLGNSDNPEKTYIEEIMPEKLNLNIKYIMNFSFFGDIGLIIKTLLKIIR